MCAECILGQTCGRHGSVSIGESCASGMYTDKVASRAEGWEEGIGTSVYAYLGSGAIGMSASYASRKVIVKFCPCKTFVLSSSTQHIGGWLVADRGNDAYASTCISS